MGKSLAVSKSIAVEWVWLAVGITTSVQYCSHTVVALFVFVFIAKVAGAS
jgi:hypothetical protein